MCHVAVTCRLRTYLRGSERDAWATGDPGSEHHIIELQHDYRDLSVTPSHTRSEHLLHASLGSIVLRIVPFPLQRRRA
jgi:hypothetical protein